jgi:hypothetical protein
MLLNIYRLGNYTVIVPALQEAC